MSVYHSQHVTLADYEISCVHSKIIELISYLLPFFFFQIKLINIHIFLKSNLLWTRLILELARWQYESGKQSLELAKVENCQNISKFQ